MGRAVTVPGMGGCHLQCGVSLVQCFTPGHCQLLLPVDKPIAVRIMMIAVTASGMLSATLSPVAMCALPISVCVHVHLHVATDVLHLSVML